MVKIISASKQILVTAARASACVVLILAGVVILHHVSNVPGQQSVMSLSNPVILRADTDVDTVLPYSSVQPQRLTAAADKTLSQVKPTARTANKADTVMKNISEETIGKWKTVRMKVTAYCPCEQCCGSADKITANGHVIEAGDCFAAADQQFPFGTELIVPGYNNSQPIKVIDRGSAITGDKLDIFFHTHWRARQWGVKYLYVRVKVPVLAAKAN